MTAPEELRVGIQQLPGALDGLAAGRGGIVRGIELLQLVNEVGHSRLFVRSGKLAPTCCGGGAQQVVEEEGPLGRRGRLADRVSDGLGRIPRGGFIAIDRTIDGFEFGRSRFHIIGRGVDQFVIFAGRRMEA